ncbi:hypothetical protein ACR3I8_03540 [Priestia flexa]
MNDFFPTNLPPFFPDLLQTMDKFYDVSSINPAFIPSPVFQPTKAPTRKSKLRILYVTFLRYPNTGGLAHYINHVKDGFSELEHHVDVLSPLNMSKEEIEVHIPAQASKAKEFMNKRYGLISEKVIKNTSFLTVFSAFLERQNLKDYDIIHAQDLFASYLLTHLNQKLHKPIFLLRTVILLKAVLIFTRWKKDPLKKLILQRLRELAYEGLSELSPSAIHFTHG